MTTMDLVEFLLARIAEDEAVAREANGRVAWLTFRNPDGSMRYTTVAHQHHGAEHWTADGHEAEPQTVAPSYDSRRVLAECDAKRRIVEHESARRVVSDQVADSRPGRYDDVVVVTWRSGESQTLTAQEFSEWCTRPVNSKVLRLLALPYADHPDYDPAWRP